MSIEACYFKDLQAKKFDAHVSVNKPAGRLAAELARAAWETCTRPEIKNALSCAAGYAGLQLPKLENGNLSAKPQLGIAVLGTPQEKESLLKAIENHANMTHKDSKRNE